jgi:hypothetical protein
MAGRHNVGLDSEAFKQAHELAARTNFCVGDAVGVAVRNALHALGKVKKIRPATQLRLMRQSAKVKVKARR